MPSTLKIVASDSLRSVGMHYAVKVDGVVVGSLTRGGNLEVDLDDGDHEVQAYFADPFSNKPNESKRSAPLLVAASNDRDIALFIRFGASAAASLTAVGGADDWLMLTPSENEPSDRGRGLKTPTIFRLLSLLAAVAAVLVIVVDGQSGTTFLIAETVLPVSLVAFACLTYLRFRSR